MQKQVYSIYVTTKNLFKRAVSHNLFHIYNFNLLAQIISLITYIITIHIFQPSVFGRYSAIIAVSSLFIPFFNFRIDQLIFAKSSVGEARELAKSGISISLILSALSAIIVSLFTLFSNSTLIKSTAQAYSIILLAFISNVNSITLSIITYEKKISNLKYWSVIQNISYLVIILLFSGLNNVTVLVCAFVFSRVTTLVLNFSSIKIIFKPSFRFKNLLLPKMDGILALFVAFCDQAIVSIPVLIVAFNFTDYHVGIFSIASTLILAPFSLFSSSMSSFFMTELSGTDLKLRNEKTRLILKNFRSTFGLLIVFSSFSFFALGIFMVSLTSGKWKDIAFTIAVLSFPYSLTILWNPISNILQSLGWWKFRLNIGLLQLVALCSLYYVIKLFNLEFQSYLFCNSLLLMLIFVISIRLSLKSLFRVVS